MLAALSRKHIACVPTWGGPASVRPETQNRFTR
jgi:hypothetical protein